jgi:hypothetical protein
MPMATSRRFGKRPATKRLLVERLEDRHLMAGNVTANVSNHALVVWGDDAANGVVLTYDSTTQKYGVAGSDTGGAPTTVNGQDTSGGAALFAGVNHVYVGLNGGDDQLQVGSAEAVDFVLRQWLSIDMGDGDDKVILGSAGNAAGGAAPVAVDLRIGTSVNVNLGAGNDEVDLANMDVGLNLNVFAGDGDDKVDFDTEFTPAGATAPQFFPVRVHGGSTLSLGGGADELKMNHFAVLGSLTILDGAGAANISIANGDVSKTLTINTGDEADVVVVDNVRAKQLSINTNGGSDDVTINGSAFTGLYVRLGAARDKLTISHSRTSLVTSLDGGAGGSAFINTSNSLRLPWRKNLG